MNQILEMIGNWNGLGQAIFLFSIFAATLGTINSVFRYIAICFSGWPSDEEDNDE